MHTCITSQYRHSKLSKTVKIIAANTVTIAHEFKCDNDNYLKKQTATDTHTAPIGLRPQIHRSQIYILRIYIIRNSLCIYDIIHAYCFINIYIFRTPIGLLNHVKYCGILQIIH